MEFSLNILQILLLPEATITSPIFIAFARFATLTIIGIPKIFLNGFLGSLKDSNLEGIKTKTFNFFLFLLIKALLFLYYLKITKKY